MSTTSNIVIAGFKRTPFHFANKGALAGIRPDDLIAAAVDAVIKQLDLQTTDIEDVIIGCAFPEAEQGFNIGKIISHLLKLPVNVAGMTVNRFCGSSMQSIHNAAGAIAAGSGDLFIVGGVESMTRVPMTGFNPSLNPKLVEEFPDGYMAMGITAENVAKEYGVSRADQEEFAVHSHKKAAAAVEKGYFNDQIIEVSGVTEDGTIRGNTSTEKMATMKPAFDENGVVTAATSSPLTDGAVATIVCTTDYAKEHGLEVLAKIRSMSVAGCRPDIMGVGPIGASEKALKRAGLTVKDIGVIELNEAFASQALAVCRELGVDMDTVNIDGGAIALGHPLGASGTRITCQAAQIMKREGKEFSLATMCIGGGQGIATVLEAV